MDKLIKALDHGKTLLKVVADRDNRIAELEKERQLKFARHAKRIIERDVRIGELEDFCKQLQQKHNQCPDCGYPDSEII